VAKEVIHHIEMMYPEAIKATSSTFKLSVRNCIYNEIMAAAQVENWVDALARLDTRKQQRRYIKALSKIKRIEVQP
jgi:hypothetical protein